MNRRSPSEVLVLALIALLAAGCGDGGGTAPGAGGISPSLVASPPGASGEERIAWMLAQAQPGNTASVPVLIRALKDPSHVSFVLDPDPVHPLGYRAAELQATGPDARELERVAAIVALERIGTTRALPDLALALGDRSALVANHAARALVRLGCRAGLSVLLANLGAQALANETANEILKELAGEDFGFHRDAGHARKQEAIGRWRAWITALDEDTQRRLAGERRPYAIGMDAETDRRIRFYVDMLGQMQFKYHEDARTALKRLGAPALSFLAEGVENARAEGRPTLSAGIAQVLAEIRHPNGTALLVDLIEDQDPTVRSRAALSLGEAGGAGALEALVTALRDAQSDVRADVLYALGTLGDEGAAAAVRRFDPGSSAELAIVRQTALFRATQGREARDAVLEMLVSGSLPARTAAYDALVKLRGRVVPYDPLAPEEARRTAARAWSAQLEAGG